MLDPQTILKGAGLIQVSLYPPPNHLCVRGGVRKLSLFLGLEEGEHSRAFAMGFP